MGIKFQIKARFTAATMFECELDAQFENASERDKLGAAVKVAIESGADLSGADLRGADLSRADLSRANLSRADLSGADLSGADLSGADLRGADLSRADLSGANLYGADLYRANLYGADLSGADLRGADLSRANLYGADLSGADLSGADLSGADLSRADLSGAKNAEHAIASTRILPEGSIIGWKKCRDNIIVKLRVPEDARRSHAFGRKCRAEFVDVIEVIGADVGISQHDGKTAYRVGGRVTCDAFDENWQVECAGGIHFFITRAEAEAY